MEMVIDVARGTAPADILLRDAWVVNVFTGEVLKTNVAIKGGLIAGVGDYSWGRETVDLTGRYLLPGLIDAHIHIESSLLTPAGFAAAVVPHGTTAVIADPHEITNVAGLDGLRYMVRASRGLPLDFFYMIPSCVPATDMETAGAELGPAEIREAFTIHPQSPGLAELMNFPGVLLKVPDVLAKVDVARELDRLIDGHAPLLGGKDLNAYLSTGISSDHECTTLAEALEKLRLGVRLIIREGSAARNLSTLLPAINERTYPNILFGCDDRHPEDILSEGEMDNILRRAVAGGLDPVTAVRIATINPARHYGLSGLGAIAPGYRADLVVVGDLEDFPVEQVYKAGRLVAKNGVFLGNTPEYADDAMRHTVHLPDLRGRLSLPEACPEGRARVIQVLPDQILTGISYSDLGSEADILKLVVVERHGRNGNVAVGLVKGFGLQSGALASTVAHDSHNLILVGTNDEDLEAAARTVADLGGGLAVVAGGRTLASLALPVAGLMSDRDAAFVAARYRELQAAARQIGCVLPSPFMTMSFLALSVIPELKMTDKGLVDVGEFKFVNLWVGASRDN